MNDSTKKTWAARTARIGYLTKAVLYALIGTLALLSVFGMGGDVDGSRGAVRTIADLPMGTPLLVVTAIGLFAYAVWRLIQGTYNPLGDGDTPVVKRVGYIVSALIHGSLGVFTVQLAMGGGSSGSDSTWIRALMGVDVVGPILVGAVGIAVLGYAAYQFYKAYTAKFTESLELSELPGETRDWVVYASRFGLAARGAVLLVIGGYLVKAAVDTQNNGVTGTGEALHEIATQPFGATLLAITAAGLVAYAGYQAIKARYLRVA